MKSGTTSLRHILNKHERIFMPNMEIFFFDIDDIEQHPDFFVETSNKWSFYNYEKNFDEYLSWYKSFFKDAEEGQIIGEASTTYMASQKAPHRIAELLPNVKLIFMLREPVSRTYSHYWHLVFTGRAIYDFEKTIQYMPNTLIQRSLYKNLIERYKEYFPNTNMKFVLFEDFIKDRQNTIDEICEFLGLGTIDISEVDANKNPAKVPRSIGLQIIYNRIFRNLAAKKYINSHLPSTPHGNPNKYLKIVDKVFKKVNLTSKKVYPPIDPQTKRFLQRLFAKENRELSELIGKNVQEYWPFMED